MKKSQGKMTTVRETWKRTRIGSRRTSSWSMAHTLVRNSRLTHNATSGIKPVRPPEDHASPRRYDSVLTHAVSFQSNRIIGNSQYCNSARTRRDRRRDRRRRRLEGELSTSESDNENGARRFLERYDRAPRISIRWRTREHYVAIITSPGSTILLPMAITIRENAGTCSGLEPDPPNKMSVWCDAWTPGVKFPVSRASTEPRASWGRAVLWKQGYGRAVPCSRIADTSISGDLMNVMRGPHDADFLCVES